MEFSGLLVQLLGSLASASALFLVAAGLSLIFGITRTVNFAHGSLAMLGCYGAVSLSAWLQPRLGAAAGFWLALPLAALAVGLAGAVIERLALRRLYAAPELLRLLATFAITLIIGDAVLAVWGPEEILGPRAPGLADAAMVLGRAVPSYDLLLIVLGPVVLLLLWLLLARTRWGLRVRAATQDRDMADALGINPAPLYTQVFALGSLLAGLAGALQLPREPAHLSMDMDVIVGAFVVVVVGGLGSLPGAYLAALLLSVVKALCIWLGTVTVLGHALDLSRATLVIDFIVMAVVLALRPRGLLGRAPEADRQEAAAVAVQEAAAPVPRTLRRLLYPGLLALLIALAALPWWARSDYTAVLATEMAIAALLAASLRLIMGPGGMASFGHAAYFGLGAYGAALAARALGWPLPAAMLAGVALAALGAALLAAFMARLSGVYLAMLTLAFAQIVWAVAFQWDGVTGGSNGLTGIWPPPLLAGSAAYWWLTLACTVAGLALLARVAASPLGWALRAARDAPLRAEASGIPVARVRGSAFVLAGALAGWAGVLYAYAKGSISPEGMAVGKSVDALIMALLGGLHAAAGPAIGAAAFTWLQDVMARHTGYWHATLGGILLALVLLLPGGIAGGLQRLLARAGRRVAG
jgi:branched-chain amino acid transport system permease protein